jgi:hypothetical protein
MLVGLRGVGKTVLLGRIREIAESEGCKPIWLETREQQSLSTLLIPELRSLLFSLSLIEAAKEKARAGLRILKSFMNGLKIKAHDIELEIGLDALDGAADSGDIERDLPNTIVAVAEAAKAAGHSIILLIDEVQYFTEEEFSSLILAIHAVNQRKLPMLLIGAGLPQVRALAGDSKSYAERLFRFPEIGALSNEDARHAILAPAEAQGVRVEPAALQQILNVTERYPYFLQQWGHDCWNVAEDDLIRQADVEEATRVALQTLDQGFFKVRLDRCTPAERRYMRALAEFGPGAHRSGDVAEKLGVKTTSVGPRRGNLIRKGMIYSPSHGDTAFTVPLFDAFMRRAMPLENDDSHPRLNLE